MFTSYCKSWLTLHLFLGFQTYLVNDLLELLDYNNSTRVRPARVKKVVGRRICVHVREIDFDGEADDEDRQVVNVDSEFWVDQSSFYVFHVGWACYNNYGLGSTKEYKKHAQRIADALSKVKLFARIPIYFSNAAVPRFQNVSLGWKKGMRFELMDPLAQMFNELRVASVLEVLKVRGLVFPFLSIFSTSTFSHVETECIPLHCTSPFMFPVGYARKYNIHLEGPNAIWRSSSCVYGSLPSECLFLQIGAKLEASDMCENHLVCPATVAAHKGRLLQIHFDGWEDSYDHSSDIFPLGWCEMHGYKLEPPKAEEEPPKKKRKK
ncbi:unnamed protein product [Angiostrongylus costaricensis]|uniref:Mbt repeat protein n=1 Tax=Angiostrongylus costaricensis TaxID=334426 RepID=A0A3P7I9C4_ANGCS|nr:unnamed protein product [Angiostrongylus costaricensis]